VGVYAIKLTNDWVDIREAKKPPVLKETIRYIQAKEEYWHTVKTKERDSWGFYIYQDILKHRTVRHPLKQTRYVGGKSICPISMKEFQKLAKLHSISLGTIASPVVELPPSLAEKFLDKDWRSRSLVSAIFPTAT
jgi:hypothetical protein